MSKYGVIVSKIINAESEEEAINNYNKGDIEDYEPSGDEYVETVELLMEI